jgi:hypothetical protein
MDYIYIRAWGTYHKLEARYVNDEIQKAHDDNAPQNVIHKRDDGTWATIEDTGSDRPLIAGIAGQLMRKENPLHPIEPPRRII